jgi:DNA (cytosine-5)-methyltransferase 1
MADQDFDTIWGGADGIVSFTTSNYSELAGWEKPVYPTIGATPPSETSGLQYGIRLENQVRRLTPLECERLQGFPDNWTEGQSDSQRYKQMGNAVAVPVVEWVIQGIVELER